MLRFPPPLPLPFITIPFARLVRLAADKEPTSSKLLAFGMCIMSSVAPAHTLVPGGCQWSLARGWASSKASSLNLCSPELVACSMRMRSWQQPSLLPSLGEYPAGATVGAVLPVPLGDETSLMAMRRRRRRLQLSRRHI